MRHLHPWLGAVAVALLLHPSSADAQSRLRFDHLTIEDGLSNNHVQSILKDSRGFIWFGTADGLNRYDGAEFVVYRHDPDDPASLPAATVAGLFEDSKKRLWIGCAGANAGLSLYDREHDRFKSYALDSKGAAGAMSAAQLLALGRTVRGFVEDREGRIWIGTGVGLARFDPDSGTSRLYPLTAVETTQGRNASVMALVQDRRERMWVATASGLLRFDRRSETYTRWPGPGDDPLALDRAEIWDLAADESGGLWIAAMDSGLHHLDPDTGRDTPYRHDPRDRTSISPGRVLRVLPAGGNRLYVAVENGGLNVLDVATGRFERHQVDPEDEYSINSSSVWAFRLDDQGILWIGTMSGGVNFVSPLGQRFQYLRARRDGLSDPHVSAILEDHLGNLWIGTDPGGLNRMDRRTAAFRYYRSRLDDPTTIGSDAVNALYEDSAHDIWLGGWDGGLGRIDPTSGRVTRYRHDPNDPTTIESNNVWCISELRSGEMLVGTFLGTDLFDRKTGRFARLSARYPEVEHAATYAVAQDGQGNIWLASVTSLQRIDRGAGRVTRYRNDPKDPQSLGAGLVQTVWVDSAGNVWTGTEGGLNCLPAGTATMRRYTTADGLPHNSVTSILEDRAGNLWLGTSRGLSEMVGAVRLPKKPLFLNFDTRDGLQGYGFIRNARFLSPSGEMFFGGARGLNSFFPDRIVRNTTPPPIALTELKVLNKTMRPGAPGSPLQKQIGETDKVTLSYKQSMITIDFAALNYLLPQKNQYAYKLEPLESDWSPAGTQRSATYTNLSPREYTFRVRAANNDGIWNENGLALEIRVTPPVWGTWWARGLALVALGAILYSWYRARTRATEARRRELEQRRRELEAEVGQRTADLRAEVAEHKRTEEKLAGEVGERRRAEQDARKAAEELAAGNAALTGQRAALEREVAERKRAEEEAGRERDLLHALMDNTPDLIYFKDRESRFTRVNRAQAQALGLADPSQAVGHTELDFLAPEFARSSREDEQAIFANGRPLLGKLEHETRSGRWYLATKVPIRGADGGIGGLVGISKDITERKLAEEKVERDLTALLEVVSAVAQGDLTHRGREGDDTLGRIAGSVNTMLTSFAGIVAEVRDVALSLSSSSAQILAAAGEISRGAEYGSDQVHSTTSAVEEMAASMTQVSKNAESSAGTAHQVLEDVEEGARSVNAAWEGIERIDSAVSETADKMRLLGRRSREIFEITNLMEEIGSSSALLALNAAIEAAHAGDAGRGFGVVADEMRRLAARSSEATRAVTQIVEGIVTETQAVLQAMENGMHEVKGGRDLSQQAQHSLRKIQTLAQESVRLSGEISVASREQAQTTGTVAAAMQAIAGMTEESSASAKETRKAVQDLVLLSENLNRAIARFKIGGGSSAQAGRSSPPREAVSRG